jgi:uncharacterized protein (DUF58 family)
MDTNPESAFPGWGPEFARALEQLAIATRRPARGQYAGAVRSRVRGRALEFVDTRPYVPGDDPRLVDWRAYARLGRLYLRQYAEERARTVTLLVDCSASLDFGDGEGHKGRFARRLAAALAWIALARAETVRVFLLREGSTASLPPAHALRDAVTLFRGLGAVQERGAAGLERALHTALAEPARGPVCLLTDLLEEDWPEALRVLAASGEGILLQILAPEEWEPALGDEVELEDAETGEVHITRLGPAEVAGYRDRLAGFQEEIRDRCRRLDVAYVPLSSGTPLTQVVLQQLTAAGVLVG